MIANLFKVATEFRFEIGHALLGTRQLQAGVDKLSTSIDNVTVGFTKLGLAAAINLGTGGGGLFGFIFRATKSWEHFRHAQLNLVNTMTANRDKLTGPIDSFNSKLAVSEAILMRVAKRGREFGLPQKTMTQMVELLAPQLVAEGLADRNFEAAIELSRQFLKAAPSFGISPQESTFQLQQAVGGRALLSQTFFQRLTVETDAMRAFAGETEKFNRLNAHKRLELITKALQQFTKDTDVISSRLDVLSTQFRIFKELIVGIDGIIRPFGKTFNDMGVDLMKKINEAVNVHGRAILENFRNFIAPITKSVEDLIVLALELRRVAGDVKRAGVTLGILGILKILGGLALLIKIVRMASGPVLAATIWLAALIKKIGLVTIVFKALWFVASHLLVPAMVLVGVFQLISRAIGYARVREMRAFPALMARFSEMMVRARNAIGRILYPFMKTFDIIAQKISILFDRTVLLKAGLFVLDKFVGFLETISDVFVSIYALAGGLGASLAMMIQAVKNLDFENFTMRFAEAFTFGFEQTLREFDRKFEGPEAPIVSNVQHFHGGIRIENKFKENQEPDRIAFTLIEQLSKAGRNKTQAAGATLRPAIAGGL